MEKIIGELAHPSRQPAGALTGSQPGRDAPSLLRQLELTSELAKGGPTELWRTYLPQVFSLLRGIVTSPLESSGAVGRTAVALRDISIYHPKLVSQYLETLVPDMLRLAATTLTVSQVATIADGEDDGWGTDIPGVAEEVLESLCGTQDPVQCFHLVLACLAPGGRAGGGGLLSPQRHISSDQPIARGGGAVELPVGLLKTGVKSLGWLSRRMDAVTLFPLVQQAMPSINLAMGSTSAELRKATVFAVVDMWLVLGDSMGPILSAHLTDSQMRLVTIYVNKTARR